MALLLILSYEETCRRTARNLHARLCGHPGIVIHHLSRGEITHAGIALVFGLVVMAMIHTFGDVSGASMNPARSLAPALVSGHGEHLWVYLLAPVLGALLAVPLCIGVREDGCCKRGCTSTH